MIRRSLSFDEWPERDRFAWTEAIAEGDIFNGRSPAAPWAPTTRYTVRAAYGRYLSFLAASVPSALAEQPHGTAYVFRQVGGRRAGHVSRDRAGASLAGS